MNHRCWSLLVCTVFPALFLQARGFAAAPCPLNPTSPSVTICTPAANTLVQTPVHVVAGTTDSNQVTEMEAFVDGHIKYKVNASVLDTFVVVPLGHHILEVWAKDSTTTTFSQRIEVGMQPPCALNPTNQTITICSVANGSVVSLPFHVVAAATDSNPVTSMNLLIDGVSQGSIANSAILDLYINNVSAAAHSLTIQGQDSTGAAFSASDNITVTTPANGLSKLGHIIFFLQENRSFDGYFGLLGPYRASIGLSNDVDGLNLNTTLPNSQGQPVHPYHYQTECTEKLHAGWGTSYRDVNYGPMNGFLRSAATFKSTIDPTGTRAIGYYDQSDIPFYYQAASSFATSDRFFSPILSLTGPNRLYLFTATSFGNIEDVGPPAGGFTQPTIFDRLDQANVSWRYYYPGALSSAFITQFATYQGKPADQAKVVPLTDWFTDVNNDATLPQVIFIERGNDEHPGNNIQSGAATSAKIINGLMCPAHSSTGACIPSASWKDSVFILTYDEGGGNYDHVLPAREIEPDSIQPKPSEGGPPGAFNQSGFRLPVIVFSPWARPSFVSHTTRDFTSILKLIEDRFNLPPLTLRDGNADDMMEFFDFSGAPPLLTPPILPTQPTNGACNTSLEAAPGY